LVGIESIEHSSALAALTFVDISGAFVDAVIGMGLFVTLAIKSRHIFGRMPPSSSMHNKERVFAGASFCSEFSRAQISHIAYILHGYLVLKSR